MKIEIATLFPDMCEKVLSESIIGRARKAGLVEIGCRNIRDYTLDKHKKVDDSPYGGGMGMVMMADPVYRCYEAVVKDMGEKPYVIYMSPEGRKLTQQISKEFLSKENLFIICGHYEGLDERVIEEIVDEEISIGDFVLTGGELPALVFVDSVVRMIDGVLSSEECFTEESHYSGLLEYAQYTKPAVWHGKEVPEVLLSGHHENIKKYRARDALSRTRKKRPDMYRKYMRNKDK
ncbi:MAG: tRNA (guanosine(37)-N1)-methyltransferase TrmD [Oscillospiraceae bacterium]|nr:tRNA (guanosine(37)-N1)-methyltransferase TrmD [Oscillospiraceae bacterium]